VLCALARSRHALCALARTHVALSTWHLAPGTSTQHEAPSTKP
jgi:hypothetical protein